MDLNSWIGIGTSQDTSLDAAMLWVENADNTDYDSNMHIAPIRYITDNFDLCLCAHFKKDFFSRVLVQTAC